ncbi:uncharacterized protein LOC130236356 isoform X2 [Danio aesculapii]|uniref:uncharacterized protein LOC130236356 isoform X2 n=1 Tax=Danio aesculapii TaxID=1142201 RepID=UPI0024BFA655|nr:uncharacterized protein LOC130236356 isoform X2 [Danio aesculapii]
MVLKRITDYLLFWTLIHLSNTDAEKVIKAVEGATVHLPCHLPPKDSQQVTVDWSINTASGYSMCTWNINMSNSLVFPLKNCLSNLTLTSKPIRLEIKNVQPGDSGKYSCKTTRVIPPPALDNNSSLNLQVAGLFLKRLNSTNDSCVHLLCSLDSELADFTWSRGGQMLPHVSTLNYNNSELHLCKPDWSEGDTITCHVSYSGTQTQKSINFNSSKASVPLDLVIYTGCGATGLILCIILPVVVCKCRKRNESGSLVFSNKVYENFSFAMSRQNIQSNDKPQTEECIYEN